MAGEVVFKDVEEMIQYCHWWQKVLRLEHWDVRCFIARKADIKPNSQAYVSWTLQSAQAVLKLMDPIDYDPGTPFAQDHEESLVHELLHLHVASFDITKVDSLEETYMERAVCHISKALVELKRRGADVYGLGKEALLRV